MDKNNWYKKFGNRNIQKYYHIVAIDNDNLNVKTYEYNQLTKKILKENEDLFSLKWWMEEEIKNNIHLIPEQNVPFLIKF